MSSLKLLIIPPIIAHRGASAIAPENTLVAFREAKRIGATWVEFDVMETLDHEVVVIHDETIDRTTNSNGVVGELSYDFLRQVDAGSWFHPRFSHEKIPTLREVINLLNELKLSANIEIKAQPGKEKDTVARVLHIIDECWDKKLAPPLISSFSHVILQTVRDLSESALLGFLIHEWQADWEVMCDKLNCAAVDVNEKIITPERIQLIKNTHRKLLAYTVNDPTRAEYLFELGVDAVFSDCPPSMFKLLKPNTF